MSIQTEAKIVSFETIAKHTIELKLSVPESFHFAAGQYISLTIPSLAHLPGQEGWHDFSIASSPSESGVLRIAFRKSESLFKTTLLAMKPGGSLLVDGPQGVFIFPKNAHHICVAGGIGITPFRSAAGRGAQQFELLYYNNSVDSAVYVPELKQNLKQHLHLIYGIPQLDELEKQHLLNPRARWYVAGPPGMVAEVRSLLKTLKVDDTVIQTEEFTGYERHS